MDYLTVKWLHILSSTILFGTGIGSAFYLLFASMTRNMAAVVVVTRLVVKADWMLTTPTAILQPLTGIYLLHLAGIPLTTRWVLWSLALYAIAIGCWLPVVWLQIRLRDCARDAAAQQPVLPARYWRLLAIWAALGGPALIAFLLVFYLMVFKPV